MANLGQKNGVFVARFRFQNKEYKKSLKTKDRSIAEGVMHRVEYALHKLGLGEIVVPKGVDAGDFIVSGGVLVEPANATRRNESPTLASAINEYTEKLGHLAASNQSTVRTHLRNLLKKLPAKADLAISGVTRKDLEGFLQIRLSERKSSTVSKERVTVQQFFEWAVLSDYLLASPAADLPWVKSSGDLPPFRTYAELEASIARGGFTPRQILALWDCLYLSLSEIAELLDMVRERSRNETSLILHAIPAYTGMRRGEVLRLRWSDIEFDQDTIVARSKKQSRQTAETMRRIDLNAELKTILLEWHQKRPTGQYVVCDEASLEALSSRQTTSRFTFPLRGTKWCLSSRRDWFKIGFHTYRHSFASNLAAAGVDQRVIDEWMGHQTEAMRRRYRHLFPRDRQSAIRAISLAHSRAGDHV